ncbi:MAG TPA: VOC family protein [Candidatus Thermoplasmatota archaeon]|nr:VOC family protein [Candidatus Thermoplasmatota archaeon]
MASPLGALGMVTLHVRDFPASLAFYRDTLGLKLLDKVDEVKWAQFEVAPNVQLGIHQDDAESGHRHPGGSSGFYFGVPDVDAAVSELARRGVTVVEKPQDAPFGRWASIEDPSGNEMMLIKP